MPHGMASGAMASSYSTPVTAVQVGTYFVNQYYQVLQQQPECAYQFYTEMSTMSRVDRDKQETASGTMEIHSRVMSLNYTGCLIELKSADAQDSLSGGVLVMVTGSIQRRDREVKRNFVQTFFLAPQENGYYVLNDIFRFCEEDSYVEKQFDALTNGDHEPQLKSVSPATEPALEPSSPATIELKREFTTATTVEEEAIVEEYNISDQQEFPILEDKLEDVSMEVSIAGTSAAVPSMETASASAPVEETTGEVTKHTYASIASKAMNKASPSTTSQSYQAPSNKPIVVVSEQHPTAQPSQQNQSLNASTEIDESQPNASDDGAGLENGGDGRSIYIKNLPLTVAAVDLELELKKFGKIKHGGVNVVNRKDTGVCYAFVDFEDSSSVQSAVGASPIQFGGRQIYIEEKRTSNTPRGRRGGRGRGFQNEGVRGRGYYVSRGRGGGQEAGREYFNRGRGGGGRGNLGNAGGNSFRLPRRSGGSQIVQNGAADKISDEAV
ncbi:nuclear transport factor 2 isoform X2 [Cryptomeria japonica]|uniref:nuclear transport factor 2 isoform X2 n=1 Tax=Cryptomeria japonica TaxID=3369 RepID=UPI0027D9D678|nr:nuclear transport factor 2 isoform X2 [Cryptomeria japonica]